MNKFFDRLFKVHAVQRYHHTIYKFDVFIDGQKVEAENISIDWSLPAYDICERFSIVKPVVTVKIETEKADK